MTNGSVFFIHGQLKQLLGHHHVHKLIVVDLTITIDIGLTDHLIDLLVSELLTKVSHDVTELSGRNESISVLVEDLQIIDKIFAKGENEIAEMSQRTLKASLISSAESVSCVKVHWWKTVVES
jgi:hypothetical protein